MGVLTTGYLMVNSWTDWRRKEVDIVWTVASFCSDGVYICRNRSETLLEWSSSGNLSVACIIVEVGSDRKRRWNCADGDRMDPGNTAGMCDFSDSDSSGGSGWGLHAGIGNGKKKGTSFCTVFIGRISGAIYLRTGNR